MGLIFYRFLVTLVLEENVALLESTDREYIGRRQALEDFFFLVTIIEALLEHTSVNSRIN
jgi:hypothetical protein